MSLRPCFRTSPVMLQDESPPSWVLPSLVSAPRQYVNKERVSVPSKARREMLLMIVETQWTAR